jgi:hypothetical protein
MQGGVRVLPLLGVDPGGLQKLEHAHDAVERGADLVAHVGQKFAFGPVGHLGLFLGRDQILLGLFRSLMSTKMVAKRPGSGNRPSPVIFLVDQTFLSKCRSFLSWATLP